MRETPRGLRADEREGAGVLFEGMGASWMRGSGWLGWGTDGGGRGRFKSRAGRCHAIYSAVFCERYVRAGRARGWGVVCGRGRSLLE